MSRQAPPCRGLSIGDFRRLRTSDERREPRTGGLCRLAFEGRSP